MSTMQNYLISRPVCGWKRCISDKPQLVQGQGRQRDKKIARREIREQRDSND